MASILANVADGIKGELEDGSFVCDIAPERSYVEWDHDQIDADTLRVDVVPVGISSAVLDGRGYATYVCDVDIGIRKRFADADIDISTGRIETSAIDTLVELVEQVVTYLMDQGNSDRKLADYTSASWQSNDITATHVREHLREMRQFTAIIRATYEVTAAL